jgi:hypothetical protein
MKKNNRFQVPPAAFQAVEGRQGSKFKVNLCSFIIQKMRKIT